MKQITEIKGKKESSFQVDPWLDRFKDVVICPQKVEKAKQTIERLGLPDLSKIK